MTGTRLEAAARELDSQLSYETPPENLRVNVWVPGHYVHEVFLQLSQLDEDVRRGAVLLPSRFFAPRLVPFAPILNLPSPIDPQDGRLDVVSVTRGESLSIDLEAIGATLGMLVDVPTLFFMIRAATHRLPFRIRVERRDQQGQKNPGDLTPPIEGHDSDRQAGLIEAGRIQRRVRVEHPSGLNVVVEEFD